MISCLVCPLLPLVSGFVCPLLAKDSHTDQRFLPHRRRPPWGLHRLRSLLLVHRPEPRTLLKDAYRSKESQSSYTHLKTGRVRGLLERFWWRSIEILSSFITNTHGTIIAVLYHCKKKKKKESDSWVRGQGTAMTYSVGCFGDDSRERRGQANMITPIKARLFPRDFGADDGGGDRGLAFPSILRCHRGCQRQGDSDPRL